MSSEFLVRIPLERIAVLIGPKGSTKKRIEELTGCTIHIDSNSGDVIIHEEEELEDPVSLWKARDMIKAIGRGFSPHNAYKINDSGYGFDLIQIRDYVGASPNALKEVRSRVIGMKGRTRNTIEQLTGCNISVFGNTIGIISEYIKLKYIKQGIVRLVNGAKHSGVYRYLEEQMRDLKINKDKLWVSPSDEEDMVGITDLDELEKMVFEEIEDEKNKLEEE